MMLGSSGKEDHARYFAFVFSQIHVQQCYVKGQDSQANKNAQVLADRSTPTKDLPL
jgi:hypothetical protein